MTTSKNTLCKHWPRSSSCDNESDVLFPLAGGADNPFQSELLLNDSDDGSLFLGTRWSPGNANAAQITRIKSITHASKDIKHRELLPERQHKGCGVPCLRSWRIKQGGWWVVFLCGVSALKKKTGWVTARACDPWKTTPLSPNIFGDLARVTPKREDWLHKHWMWIWTGILKSNNRYRSIWIHTGSMKTLQGLTDWLVLTCSLWNCEKWNA